MNSTGFRKELTEIMPGYEWTVHRTFLKSCLFATGTQSSGFNRLSTLRVERSEKGDDIKYDVRTSGFGKRARWLSEYSDGTLARALRGLQKHYEIMAREYGRHAAYLEGARKKKAKGVS